MDGLSLAELRKARGITQRRLAGRMHVAPQQISAMELRKEHKISGLAKYIDALGGELELVITFPDTGMVHKVLLARTERRQGSWR